MIQFSQVTLIVYSNIFFPHKRFYYFYYNIQQYFYILFSIIYQSSFDYLFFKILIKKYKIVFILSFFLILYWVWIITIFMLQTIIQNIVKSWIIAILSIVLVSAVIILVVAFITSSLILAFLLYFFLIWLFIRIISMKMIFPGSFFFMKAELQIRMSKQLQNKIGNYMSTFASICKTMTQHTQNHSQSQEYHYDYHTSQNLMLFVKHVGQIIEMLDLYANSLSQRKMKLLEGYILIKGKLEFKVGGKLSTQEYILDPHFFLELDLSQRQAVLSILKQIQTITTQILQQIQTFKCPQKLLQSLLFYKSGQRLYELRFKYYEWKHTYKYQKNTITTHDNCHLQTVIIHKQLNSKRKHKSNKVSEFNNDSKIGVLFCNPNGVFLQTFGFENQYVKNYLRQGYHVILWNYRGYAESTGSPSIQCSQKDAFKIHQYYSQQGFIIKIIHGYSIGGAAAIGLQYLLQANNKSQLQQQKNRTQILIIDRSFASLSSITRPFHRIIGWLTKFIVLGDDIDLSQQFFKIMCSKLIIWDFCDQIISDRASLKSNLLKMKKRQVEKRCKLKVISDNKTSNNKPISQDIPTAFDIQYSTLLLSEIVKRLLPSPTKDRGILYEATEEMKEDQQTSMSSFKNEQIEKQRILFQNLDIIDGGGIRLFVNPEELIKIIHNKPEYLLHICQSFILGLICYGSFFPQTNNFSKLDEFHEETITKINRLLNKNTQSFGNYNHDPHIKLQITKLKRLESLNQVAHGLNYLFTTILQQKTSLKTNKEWQKYGHLLPTYNGHNSQLSTSEFDKLNDYIKSRLISCD